MYESKIWTTIVRQKMVKIGEFNNLIHHLREEFYIYPNLTKNFPYIQLQCN
jgi:hypothetical protein